MQGYPELPDRVAVLLAEIETVRDIFAIGEESELTRELRAFVAALSRRIRSSLPTLGEWPAPQIEERCIRFSPHPPWKVLRGRSSRWRDHSVTLLVDLGKITHPDPLWGDAYVGVAVPENWRKAESFASLLGKIKLTGFQALVNADEQDEFAPTVPLWSDIHYAAFAGKGVFDTRGFINAIVDRLRVLLTATKRIESAIEKAKKGRVQR
jgi:hypothetical protein